VTEAREGRAAGRWLWGLVVVLALACSVGGLQVARAHDTRAADEERHARYAEVMRAASAEAEAFVNVGHDTAEADLARIAAGATGPLRDRYTHDVDRVVRALRRDGTVTSGKVVWTGVLRVDPDGATVLVATTGTRADRGTDGKPVARDLRLRLRLVPVGGHWLASDIEQVD
jgi:Mce-associated membrane protein